ncbi:MAG: sigma-70 family RNA polymerase sigma factor [Oscillospiraceae bacterium]|nr:sigma-70 family RNA polymerase sigma factor [Oscillospiraceae bacterium]
MEPERLAILIEKAKQGNKSALEELFMGAWNSIYRLALRILKNPEDAEDITQEVFITIQQKISGLREPTSFYAWANQITANKCNRFFSKHKGLITLEDEDELLLVADDDPENMPDKALDDEANRQIIMSVIDNLPDNQRICILLFYYGQLTVADIAVALETNENTIKTRLSMARAKIRAALEEKAEKDGIKLWGIPLALTPIIREAMEHMPVPAEVQARMQDCVQTADTEVEYLNAEPQQAIENPGDTLTQADPMLGVENVAADSAVNSATATAETIGAALSKKAIALVCTMVCVGAIATTAIFWPQISEVFSRDGGRTPSQGIDAGANIHPGDAIAAGNSHSLVVGADGGLWAWGSNVHGRLGDGTTDDRTSSVRVIDDVVAVSAGGEHSLAVDVDGGLWAWGSNSGGRLGSGTFQGSSTPIRIMDDVIAVSASSGITISHSLAISADGSLWAWGSNSQGRLGTGSSGSSRIPVRIMDDIIAVCAGHSHSLALDTDGGLWAWGSGHFGRIGDGTIRENRTYPIKIMDDIAAISAGGRHSLVIGTDGGLWAWGANFYGAVGCGTGEQRHLVPIRVMDDVVAVSAGYIHSLAITADGSLWAWGSNAHGRLGIGGGSRQRYPIRVMGDVVAISAGHRHSLAVTSDGSLWAWGYNGDGRLGDGTTENRHYPIRILDNITLPTDVVSN